MPMSMKENGKTIKPTEKELILMLMELNILVNGKMINKKVKEKKYGPVTKLLISNKFF